MNEVLATDQARRALAAHDIATVYRLLREAGVSQRQIAELTGQSQSEVSEILSGRRVMAYDVLERICEGLDVPREWMGLAYHGDAEPAGPDVGEEMDEAMKRRALIALAGATLVGAPVLGEVLHIPARPATPTPLPSRLGATDVTAIKKLTAELRTMARTYGGCADVITGVAYRSRPLMSVSASEEIHAELGSALADLHTLAGWCCVDAGHHDQARAHFASAMDLAATSGDGCQMASALRHTGIQMIDAGAYNDGLKAYQLGLIKLSESPDSPEVAEATAWLTAESALPLAAMGQREAAQRAIATAREQFRTADMFDDADMDYLIACVYRRLGRLDSAETFAASSVRKWAVEGTSRRTSVEADIVLATLHTQTGQSDAAALARRAIAGVVPLRSVRARRVKLVPLVEALDARTDSTSRALAASARQVLRSA